MEEDLGTGVLQGGGGLGWRHHGWDLVPAGEVWGQSRERVRHGGRRERRRLAANGGHGGSCSGVRRAARTEEAAAARGTRRV